MEWQVLIFVLQFLLLVIGWALFQQARGELSAQAAEAPVLGEVKALAQGVRQMLAELETSAGRYTGLLEERLAESRCLLNSLETVLNGRAAGEARELAGALNQALNGAQAQAGFSLLAALDDRLARAESAGRQLTEALERQARSTAPGRTYSGPSGAEAAAPGRGLQAASGYEGKGFNRYDRSDDYDGYTGYDGYNGYNGYNGSGGDRGAGAGREREQAARYRAPADGSPPAPAGRGLVYPSDPPEQSRSAGPESQKSPYTYAGGDAAFPRAAPADPGAQERRIPSPGGRGGTLPTPDAALSSSGPLFARAVTGGGAQEEASRREIREIRRQRVYDMADAGEPLAVIARTAGLSQGEVETLLGLRSQPSQHGS